MKQDLPTIVVLVRKKKTDAYICELLSHHAHLIVIRYGVPHSAWYSWIIKRLRQAGPIVLLGHLTLSVYLKISRLIERVCHNSIWQKYGEHEPSWKAIPVTECHSEQALRLAVQGAQCILATDAFRLSQAFFRATVIPYYEIIWSNAVKYRGDSAAFWAYVNREVDAAAVTVARRVAYFNTLQVCTVRQTPVLSSGESLRSIKVKQAIALKEWLPNVCTSIYSEPTVSFEKEEIRVVRQCYAPTFWWYLSFRLFDRRIIPSYAWTEHAVHVRYLSHYA